MAPSMRLLGSLLLFCIIFRAATASTWTRTFPTIKKIRKQTGDTKKSPLNLDARVKSKRGDIQADVQSSQTRSTDRTHTQDGHPQLYADPDTDGYLRHKYYDVFVSRRPEHQWRDISAIGSLNPATLFDDCDGDNLDFFKIDLSFPFSFYGWDQRQIFVDPNGFIQFTPALYCNYGFCNWRSRFGESVYQRYIAPFMTDFWPGATNNSRVYVLEETIFNQGQLDWRLTVQWNNVTLFVPSQNYTYNWQESYTFQLIMYSNGDIVFNYRSIPANPVNINHVHDRGYPLNIGVGDSVFILRERLYTLYPYYPIELNYSTAAIAAQLGYSIYLRANPTCLSNRNCSACVDFTNSQKGDPNRLQCGWCPETDKCTDGIGREQADLPSICLSRDNLINDIPTCIAGRPKSSQVDYVLAYVLIPCSVLVAGALIFAACYVKRAWERKKRDQGGPSYQAGTGDALPVPSTVGAPNRTTTHTHTNDDERETSRASKATELSAVQPQIAATSNPETGAADSKRS